MSEEKTLPISKEDIKFIQVDGSNVFDLCMEIDKLQQENIQLKQQLKEEKENSASCCRALQSAIDDRYVAIRKFNEVKKHVEEDISECTTEFKNATNDFNKRGWDFSILTGQGILNFINSLERIDEE